MPHERAILGSAGEHLAERVLVRRGWRIVQRNARTRYGEIDLVCHDGGGYVFVEVKTRREGSFVSAVEATSRAKLERLARLGEMWLVMHGIRGAEWRLAVIAVTVGTTGSRVQLVDVSG